MSGGYAGNIAPGQIDVMLFSFTEEAAQIIDPNWTMNPLGNWYFILAIVIVFTPIIWFITDRVIEPRLGTWGGVEDAAIQAELAKSAVTPAEKKGLAWAGLAALALIVFVAALTLWPGFTPLLDETREGPSALEPFYRVLAPMFLLLFLFCGIAFGVASGSVANTKDVLDGMIDGARSMAPTSCSRCSLRISWRCSIGRGSTDRGHQWRGGVAIHGAADAVIVGERAAVLVVPRSFHRFGDREMERAFAGRGADVHAAWHIAGDDHGGVSHGR